MRKGQTNGLQFLASWEFRDGQFRDRHMSSVDHQENVWAKVSEPERDTTTWYQDFKESQKRRRRLCQDRKPNIQGNGLKQVGLSEAHLTILKGRGIHE